MELCLHRSDFTVAAYLFLCRRKFEKQRRLWQGTVNTFSNLFQILDFSPPVPNHISHTHNQIIIFYFHTLILAMTLFGWLFDFSHPYPISAAWCPLHPYFDNALLIICLFRLGLISFILYLIMPYTFLLK